MSAALGGKAKKPEGLTLKLKTLIGTSKRLKVSDSEIAIGDSLGSKFRHIRMFIRCFFRRWMEIRWFSRKNGMTGVYNGARELWPRRLFWTNTLHF